MSRHYKILFNSISKQKLPQKLQVILGFVVLCDDRNNRATKRIFNTTPEGKGETGRPELRWGIA
jgi:hypothetical protein